MNVSKDINSNYLRSNITKGDSPLNNSKFKSLYIEIQNQIRNIVIIKLHNQISKLIKEMEKLKKENMIIKNDLVYILKRIIINKKEYNIVNPSINNIGNNSCINLNLNSNIINPNSSSLSLNKSKNSFLSNEKAFNAPISNNHNTSRTKISLIRTPDNYNNISSFDNNTKQKQNKYFRDKSPNKSIDSKIDGYLNSLYRHNFIDNYIGAENNYNLNKSKGIYEELFNTQCSINESNKTNNSSQKNMNISSIDEVKEKGKANSAKKIKYNQYKNLNIKINKYNCRKKIEDYKIKINVKDNANFITYLDKKNKTNRNLIKKKDIISKGIDLENDNIYVKKSNSKINIIHINRSPFLVNKF